jgi:PAS domain S-box-containing protein
MKPSDFTRNEPASRTTIPDALLAETAQALINATDELVVLTSEDGSILALNDRFAQRYESNGDTLIGSSVYDVMTGHLAGKVRERAGTVLRDGKVARFEGREDGLWLEVVLYPIPDSLGTTSKVAIFMKDITNEHRYEEALRESEKKYRHIVDTANEGICVVDRDFRVTLFNRQAEIMFGYREEEMIGRSLDDLICEEDREDHSQKMHRRSIGISDQYERRFRQKNGQPLWVIVSASPILNGKNRFSGSISLFANITRRKNVEEAVKESEERYRTAIEHSNDGVVMVRDDVFIYVNHRFVDMFGYNSADQIIGQSQAMTIHPEAAELVATMNRKRQSGEDVPERYEFKGMRKDGATVHVEVSATKTQYRGETVTLAYLRDITTRKQMEDELLNFRKLESIGILAGGIAHDFNNLLMSMLGYISLAKLYLQPTESRARDKLTEAEKTIGKANELTTQLLTFSKGGSPLKKKLRLQPIVREASRMTLSGSQIKCKYHMQENLWAVRADEIQLRQAIHQLVRNAREATPEEGSITISARNRSLEPVEGAILPAGDYVELTVSDTGKGIAREHLSQVFDPYFTTKDFGPQKGMGLGLAVCYSIIKKHGGQIEVESEIGQGATFRIYLPADNTQPSKTPPPHEKASNNDEKLRILIVDDERSILQTTSMLLTRLGHDVAGVPDGRKGIDLYRQSKESGSPFDIVILDLISPTGPGGVQILEELLRIDPAVRAVLSSGYSSDPQIVNHKEHGFKGGLLKPYRIEDLIEVLKKVMGKTKGLSYNP